MPTEKKSPFSSLINWAAVLTAVAGWLASPEFQAVIPPKVLPYIISFLSLVQLIRRNFFPVPPTTEIAADKVK